MINDLTNYNDGILDPLFDLFAPVYKESKYRSMPMKTDIKEEENDYRLDVDLPGVKKENISVSFKDGYLKIEAHSDAENENKEADGEKAKEKYIRRERYYVSTSRSYYLGEVDEKNITAKYENGVLSLFVPKAKPIDESETKIAIL